MLGIALGSFAQGFSQGIDAGQRLHEIKKARKLEAGLATAESEGRAEFEADKAAGTAEGNFEDSYEQYFIPKISHQYALAGEPEMAIKWKDWNETANAKKGAKLFGAGLSKLQSGDVQGGVNDMVKSANLSGYGPDGKVTAAEYYDEEAGAVTGYKFTFEGADGKPQTKSVAVGDVAQFLAGIANPKSAFEMDQESKAAHSKADLEVETHGRKKKLEKELGVGTGAMTEAQYQNAIQEEVKQLNDRKLTGTDPDLEDMDAAAIEQRARETVDARLGNSATPAEAGPQVTVDPETGEQIQIETPTPTTPADDAATPTTPADDAAQPPAAPTDEQLGVGGETSSAEPPAQAPQVAGVNAPTPAAETTQIDPTTQQAYVAQASQMLKQGAPAQQIAQQLVKAGVSPDKWPQDLQLAARNAQLGVA